MNVQTEKLENHVARLTVEIDADQLEKAKKQAAKRLARQVNIPGFRKGKAPYRILVNYIGEAPIIEEAIDNLGNEIYPKALDEAKVEPYTTGSLEDFKLDPPTFVFTVPLQPEAELNDYLSVRVPFEPVEVEDKDVDEALRRLQEEHALVEESQQPAAKGNRITADIHGFFVDEEDAEAEEEAEEAPSAEDEEHDHDHDHEDLHNAPIHQHDAFIYLEADREPVAGFADALVGVQPEETREFEITYPDDEEKYGEIAGRTVKFIVTVKAVDVVTLPELNDAFAAKVSEEDEDEEEELTLVQLRARLRENIQKQLESQQRAEYVEEVMDEMVEVADFAYPEAMIVNQIDSMVESTASRYGLSVDDYLALMQMTHDDLHQNENYREAAERYIQRSLIMRGILEKENLKVSAARIDEEIGRVLSQFGEQAEMYRQLFDTPEMRSNVSNNLLEERILDRIVAIGRGEELEEETEPDADDEQQTEPETADADAEAAEDVSE